MAYELRHFDTPLLRFQAIDSTYAAELKITWLNEEKQNMLPLDLELSNDGLYKWLKRRVIPRNRVNVHSFLSKCGLNLNLDYTGNSPGQNTGVGSLSLLQGIFPTQRSNLGPPHCRWILYAVSHQGKVCFCPICVWAVHW